MKNTLPLSSFPLQLLLTIEIYYQFVFSGILLLLLIFKTYNLRYSSGMSAQEGILQFLFFFIMLVRIHQGIGANKTEDYARMALFLALTLIGIVFCIYFIVLQYYVLLIEIILSSVLIFFMVFEMIFGFFSCWQFQSYEKSR